MGPETNGLLIDDIDIIDAKMEERKRAGFDIEKETSIFDGKTHFYVYFYGDGPYIDGECIIAYIVLQESGVTETYFLSDYTFNDNGP
jgi:hypothetical protein